MGEKPDLTHEEAALAAWNLVHYIVANVADPKDREHKAMAVLSVAFLAQGHLDMAKTPEDWQRAREKCDSLIRKFYDHAQAGEGSQPLAPSNHTGANRHGQT
jgi:hypothetical protein